MANLGFGWTTYADAQKRRQGNPAPAPPPAPELRRPLPGPASGRFRY